MRRLAIHQGRTDSPVLFAGKLENPELSHVGRLSADFSVLRTPVMPRFHYSRLVRIERDVTSTFSFPYQRTLAGRQCGFPGGRSH
jgi:hypothetical protein